MSTLKSLRDRLRAVNNMLHITEAMEVVASVRFRKLSLKMEHLQFYANKLIDLIHRLQRSNALEPHPLFIARKPKKMALIIIGGDKGLCGSYNANIFKEAENFLKSLPVENVELILFGNKTIDYFARQPWKIKTSIPDFNKKLTESNIKHWAQQYTDAFENEDFDQLWVAFTRFRNVLSREASIEKILPLENGNIKIPQPPIDFIFEPSPEEIYQHVIPLGFAAKIHTLLLESYASELSSRMIAMKAATKNAEEMIEKLTLIKNKNRQLSITNEILEITAGAEGLK